MNQRLEFCQQYFLCYNERRVVTDSSVSCRSLLGLEAKWGSKPKTEIISISG